MTFCASPDVSHIYIVITVADDFVVVCVVASGREAPIESSRGPTVTVHFDANLRLTIVLCVLISLLVLANTELSGDVRGADSEC